MGRGRYVEPQYDSQALDPVARASATAARALAQQVDEAVGRMAAADRLLSLSRAALSAALRRHRHTSDDAVDSDPWRTDTDAGAPGVSMDAATLFSLTQPADGERVPPRPHLLLATAAVAAAADDEDSGGDEREQGADSLAATPEHASPWQP